MRHRFAPGFVNYKKRCTRLAAASDKVYQLLAHGRWFSPGTLASSTTQTKSRFDEEIFGIPLVGLAQPYSLSVPNEELYFHWILWLTFLCL
jgi:hypothetical protein